MAYKKAPTKVVGNRNDPPTEAQLKFLTSLIAERTDMDIEVIELWRGAGCLNKGFVSDRINEYTALPKINPSLNWDIQPPSVTTKINVTSEQLSTTSANSIYETIVEAVSKTVSETPVVLQPSLNPHPKYPPVNTMNINGDEYPFPPVRNAATGEVLPNPYAGAKPGYYVTGPAGAKEFWVVVESTANPGRTYAKVLTKDPEPKPGQKPKKWDWVYTKGAVRRFVGQKPLTIEEAAEWGRLHGYCMICHRPLSTPASVKAGMGPVCRKRLQFPAARTAQEIRILAAADAALAKGATPA